MKFNVFYVLGNRSTGKKVEVPDTGNPQEFGTMAELLRNLSQTMPCELSLDLEFIALRAEMININAVGDYIGKTPCPHCQGTVWVTK